MELIESTKLGLAIPRNQRSKQPLLHDFLANNFHTLSQTVNAKPTITCFAGGSHCIDVPSNQAYLICVAVLYNDTLAWL